MFRTVFLVVSVLILSGSSMIPAQASSFELLSGVVVDQDLPAMYLMNPDQGIDALNASSGSLLWSSPAAAKPLAVRGDLLVAQAEPPRSGVLSLVVLNRGDGTQRQAFNVDLPKGVKGTIADILGSSFRAWASVEGGEILVGWENIQKRVSPLPPKKGEKLRSRLTGGARIDLLTKVVTPLAAAPSRQAAPVARLASDNGSSQERIVAGAVSAQAQMVGDDGEGRLVLKRWEAGTGTPMGDVTLVNDPYHLRMPSVDGRHLLVSSEANLSAHLGYTFQLFSLETGELLGSLHSRRSNAVGFVLDQNFVYESLPYVERQEDGVVSMPRQLRSVDLSSGELVWERPLRDLAYRGPYRR